MQKYFLCWLVFSVSAFAQTKPLVPVTPYGTWADSLKRAYFFGDSGSSPIVDYSGHEDGTVFGTLTWTRNSSGDLYMRTPGTSGNYLRCGNNLLTGNPPNFTVFIRFRFTQDYGGKYIHGVTGTSGTSSVNHDWALYDLASAQRIGFSVTNTSGSSVVVYNSTSKQYSIDTDYSIILTYDSDSLRYYNGVGANSYTAADHNLAVRNTPFYFYLGRAGGGFNDMGFYVLCFWTRILTAYEREEIMGDPYVMFRVPTLSGRRKMIGTR